MAGAATTSLAYLIGGLAETPDPLARRQLPVLQKDNHDSKGSIVCTL